MTRFLSEPAILRPYDPDEVIDIAEAARRAGQAERTIREWCPLHGIGRKIGGRWKISGPALDMLLEGDIDALTAYLAGDRETRRVMRYFERRGIRSEVADRLATSAAEYSDTPPDSTAF